MSKPWAAGFVTFNPRVRGEHVELEQHTLSIKLQPPRARGTPWLEAVCEEVIPSTPACAGNTTTNYSSVAAAIGYGFFLLLKQRKSICWRSRILE